jgi:hypothetical protein
MRQTQGLVWRERTYPTRWWRRPFVRTIASVNLDAPDGRTFEVRVSRLLWPPRGGVWGVRVETGSGPRLFRSFVYGEEHRERADALERAYTIADGMKQGKKPSEVE